MGNIATPANRSMIKCWATLRVDVGVLGSSVDATASGLKSIDYEIKSNAELVLAAGMLPVGSTAGQEEYDGSIEVLRDDLEGLQALLGAGWMHVPIAFTIIHPGNVNEAAPSTDKIIGKLNGAGHSLKQGGGATTVKIPFMPTSILINGVPSALQAFSYRPVSG